MSLNLTPRSQIGAFGFPKHHWTLSRCGSIPHNSRRGTEWAMECGRRRGPKRFEPGTGRVPPPPPPSPPPLHYPAYPRPARGPPRRNSSNHHHNHLWEDWPWVISSCLVDLNLSEFAGCLLQRQCLVNVWFDRHHKGNWMSNVIVIWGIIIKRPPPLRQTAALR